MLTHRASDEGDGAYELDALLRNLLLKLCLKQSVRRVRQSLLQLVVEERELYCCNCDISDAAELAAVACMCVCARACHGTDSDSDRPMLEESVEGR